MTSRAMTTSSGVTASVSTRRPLVHQRQISFLALPPLLQPIPLPNTNTGSTSQSHSHSTLSTPREPTPPISSYSALPTTSILRPPTRPTGSLIAHLQQHQAQQQQQKRLLSTSNTSEMSEQIPEIITRTRAAASGIPGEQVEPRQTLPTEDMEPNPANSIPLPPNRQKLVEDIIALYSCQITVDRVARYAPGTS